MILRQALLPLLLLAQANTKHFQQGSKASFGFAPDISFLQKGHC